MVDSNENNNSNNNESKNLGNENVLDNDLKNEIESTKSSLDDLKNDIFGENELQEHSQGNKVNIFDAHKKIEESQASQIESDFEEQLSSIGSTVSEVVHENQGIRGIETKNNSKKFENEVSIKNNDGRFGNRSPEVVHEINKSSEKVENEYKNWKQEENPVARGLYRLVDWIMKSEK